MLDFSICSVLYHHLHIFFSLHSHFWQTHTTHTYLHTHTTHHTCTHVHTNTPHARTQHVGTPTLTASHYWGILKVMIMSYMGFWAFQKLSKTSLNKITAGSSDSPMWYSGCLRGSLALSLGPLFCLCPGQLLCGAGAESVGIFALVRHELAQWHLQSHTATCCRHPQSNGGKAAGYCGTPLFFKTRDTLQFINIY